MTLTQDQLADMKLAAQPLVDWLRENCHPHVTAIVDGGRAEILEGLGVATFDIES